jgi:hypothetical protein
MRRFLIWSALAVVIGLAVAGGGYWAYWNFYARFQPVTVARNQAEIQRLLDEASWVSEGGGGQPLYIIGYRDSAASQRYEREEAGKLRAGGVEVRVVVFARPDKEGQALSTAPERATVAELWLSRDWSLYQRWTATPAANWTAAGIPAADGNLARSAVVDASRAFVVELTDLLRDAGVPTGYPLVIWRDREGFMKACACSDARSWAFIRDDFAAPGVRVRKRATAGDNGAGVGHVHRRGQLRRRLRGGGLVGRAAERVRARLCGGLALDFVELGGVDVRGEAAVFAAVEEVAD